MSNKKNSIPVTAESRIQMSCEDCTAACCRAGTNIRLTRKDLRRFGDQMALRTVIEPSIFPRLLQAKSEEEGSQILPAGFGSFVMTEDCGYLAEDNRCSIYDDKPAACDGLEPGTIPCLILRGIAGYKDRMPSNLSVLVFDAIQAQQQAGS